MNAARKRLAFRALLAAGALVYAALLLREAAAAWIVRNPTQRRLQLELRWNAGNPEVWKTYARSVWQPMDDSGSPEVIRAYRRALAGNPFDVDAWDDLASEYFRLGQPQPAEAALRAALAAVPRSSKASWRLANFLLLQGRQEESYPFFRAAAASDERLLDPLFELGWKLLGDPRQIFDRLVPEAEEGRARYLDFLIRKRLLREAFPIWQQVLPTAPQRFIEPGEGFAAELALAGIGDLAERVWADATHAAGLPSCRPPGEAVCNGDFEAPLRNAGLDWRIGAGPGYRVSFDNFEARSGARSLRVEFDGTTNPEFDAVRQWIPVEPNTTYEFQGDLMTLNLSTTNGMFLSLSSYEAPPDERWERASEELVGSTPWTRVALEVHTGPGTRVLFVQLRRRQSGKLNHLLRGTVWLDSVSLRRLTR